MRRPRPGTPHPAQPPSERPPRTQGVTEETVKRDTRAATANPKASQDKHAAGTRHEPRSLLNPATGTRHAPPPAKGLSGAPETPTHPRG
ncbi:hypothetical protein JCM10135_13180 [Stetteria hydrogenophila]